MSFGERALRVSRGWLWAMALCAQAPLAWAVPPSPTPFDRVHFSTFDSESDQTQWDANSGQWAVADGTYNNRAANTQSLSTINAYVVTEYQPEPDRVEMLDDYVFSARLLNSSAAANTQVGLVLNYRDTANYDEVIFAPNRVAQLRRVTRGAITVVAETTYSEGGQGKWLDVEIVRRVNAFTSVVVNGNLLFGDVSQGGVPRGRLGVVAYGTLARFENVAIDRPNGSRPLFEDFTDGQAQNWPPIDGNNWTIANGALQNFTVLQTNRVQLPVTTGEWSAPFASVRARLLSPYSASGNLVGLSFGNGLELTFSRKGVATLQGVDGDGKVIAHTAAIPLLPKDWFEVVLDFDRFATVRLNGQVIFRDVMIANNVGFAPEGPVSLLTHWSPGQFDRIEFQHVPFPVPYTQDFTVATQEVVALRGIWATRDGLLSSQGLGPDDFTVFAPSPTRQVMPRSSFDFRYRARLNMSAASGSIGLITHYGDNGEFYEVLFTPAGEIQVNKHVQGTVVRQATGTHAIAPNTWFAVEVHCVNNKTSIDVNGVNRLSGILQGQLREGRIGVITHDAPGSFDDVSWSEIK